MTAACLTRLVPEGRRADLATADLSDRTKGAALLHNRPFRYVVLVAAVILGGHAMHDGFAMIAWNEAGITPGTGSILWSTGVAAEIVVFFLLALGCFSASRPQRQWRSRPLLPLYAGRL